MDITFLGKDIINKILILCVDDLENIKQTSNVACEYINNYTIPYMIGNFFGNLNKDILNMIFIKCCLIDTGKTISNLRRTCKYIDHFVKIRALPSIVDIMEAKRTKILDGPYADEVKNILRDMKILKFEGEEDNNEEDVDDDDNMPPTRCKLCSKFVKNKIVICDHVTHSKIYCYQCFLHYSFVTKVTPLPFNEIDNLLIYAVNYNILRIASGMGGLHYA
jgi:hypothetical protein